MRLRPVIALLGLCLVTACSHGSARLAGHWRGVRAEGAPAGAEDSANAFAGKMTIDVEGSSITVTTAAGPPRKDGYKVISEDATVTVIATERDGLSDPQTFTFLDAKTMRWAASPGKAIVFTKE